MSVPKGTTTKDVYPDRWLKANDLEEEGAILTIADVNLEELGEDKTEKLVLLFKENTKCLALNKTNVTTLEKMLGIDPNTWIGQRVTVYPTEVAFGGKMVETVRIKTRIPKAASHPVVQAEPEPDMNYEPNQEEPAY